MPNSANSGSSLAQNSPNQSASSQSRQSQHQLRSNLPETKEQALTLTSGNVKKLTAMKLFLAKHGYIAHDWVCSLRDLALVLFQLAVSAKSTTAADRIKAVALILEAFKMDSHVNRAADAVLNKLGDPLEQITNAASKITRQQEGFRECSGVVHTPAEYIAEQADITANAINEACTTLSQQADKIGIINNKNAAPTNNNINPLTYAAITAMQFLPSHSSFLARGWEFQCQIILDAAPGMPSDQGLTDLSEVNLLAKANTAYELMKVGKNDAPEGLRFIGARKLARGSIVLDLNSMEATIWL
ncbi:hypothetical protein PILCRDRAFT_5055 [Piloderma croceum F 1598]|uniref:Uncharacterized protein n=1 Tax=Piloderma croceum (strain F 1598) TaxID=765440 RepID=A0A0C3FPD6_PILCF|nr:hypothetical protein PILCRDRAFT_5055 [Piloderma croceum F 1598]